MVRSLLAFREGPTGAWAHRMTRMAPSRAILFQLRRNPALNTETGSSCRSPAARTPTAQCRPCAGLAVPYVPFQQNGSKKYSQSEALSNGTLFPGLNLPFHLKTEGSALPSNPLVELQALEFVVLELGTYLDTHPDDMEAFDLFKQYAAHGESRQRDL